MGKLVIFVGVVVVLVTFAGIFLANWDIPPPTARIEKIVPDSRFDKK